MKVGFITLGCRVNRYETDAVREQFIENGFEAVPSEMNDKADIIVVNTCTVTSEADRQSRQTLRKSLKLNPNVILCAMGCAVEMTDGVVDADIICGTRDKHELVSKVKEYLTIRTNPNDTTRSRGVHHTRPEVSTTDTYQEFGTTLSPTGTRAFVKIEDGCNNFCSYCIIPYARGRVVSRDADNILAEVAYLASQGYKEIILTGIHLCSYGLDKDQHELFSSLTPLEKQLFAQIGALGLLVEKISQIEGVERIRLGSLEPKTLSSEFLRSLANNPKFCPHFHISLQSGCDTVLSRMNRKYNTDEYSEKVKLIESLWEDFSLTTDVIAGFPEETCEEHKATLEFVDRLPFAKLHVFPYSLREGTKASKMAQLDKKTKKDRAREIIEISDRHEVSFANHFVGRNVEILVEQIDDNYMYGYSKEYVYSKICRSEDESVREMELDKVGEIVKALVVTADDANLICKIDIL